MARRVAAWSLWLVLLVAAPLSAQVSAEARRLAFGETVLAIESGDRVHRMRVQLAVTPSQMARGLMFRRTLDPWDGMLFDFGAPEPAHIWMKNTYLPLDVIFIQADGTIESIAKGVPETISVMSSKGPVRAVLELPRGTAKRLGFGPGDVVRHRIFGRAVD